ncbi:MAG: hypothetical protein NWE93_04975 [Candidatus Bathyarchaeota archaeon]|nr:hypothetical protein [Candidatus Bathyarchaeota archaeon]
MNHRYAAAIATVLVLVVVFSLFAALNWFGSNRVDDDFYLGVEFAYGDQPAQVQALVDKVKGYTNLLVLGSVELTFNQTALTEACDIVYAADLNFIVLFTGLEKYDYHTWDWMVAAQAKYGERFLGVYRYDEPGGNQLDNGASQLIHSYDLESGPSYAEVSRVFVGNLSYFPAYYLQYAPKMFTSDYALHWFDYKANYTTVFTEFVGNESRQRSIALCRGAAQAFNKDWGAIVTWKYNQEPYLESPQELKNDLTLAYSAGAKYAVVFSYPDITGYGILTEEHFEVLEDFWNTIHSSPQSITQESAEAAYVVPADYGFGFRVSNDSIWGLFPADELSAKIYGDVETLTLRYGSRLDILYDGAEAAALLPRYSDVYFYNQTIT